LSARGPRLVPIADLAAARFVSSAGQQVGGIAGAIAASAACFGAPALVSTLTAVGATTLTEPTLHAIFYPLFVGSIAFSLWRLHCSTRSREKLAPFLLGLAGGATAAVFLWLMVTGIVPLPGWALFAALAVLMAGSLWEIGARYLEVCIVKVRREMTQRKTPQPRNRRLANGTALGIAAAAAFYGMYRSVETFAPRAESGEIACYGINGCKGQTACATAHNACAAQNTCKGKGFLYATAKECAAQGGAPLRDSPADPGPRQT
jgi:hypothetical protein